MTLLQGGMPMRAYKTQFEHSVATGVPYQCPRRFPLARSFNACLNIVAALNLDTHLPKTLRL
jgi:hypothetical protein